VVLGRGGVGKSALARRLGTLTGLPVVELDTLFWKPGPNVPDAAPRPRAGGLLALGLRLPAAQPAPGDAGDRRARPAGRCVGAAQSPCGPPICHQAPAGTRHRPE